MHSKSDAPQRGAAVTSAMTMRDVLALPLVRRGIPEVVWGERHLGRRVRWAHVMELPDPSRLLRGGELVLTTGLGIGDGRARQRHWIDALAGQDVAALAVELGLTYRERLPKAIIDACREHRLPLVTFGRRVRYVELTEAINSAILDRQAAVLRRAATLQDQLVSLLLDEQGVAEILELVAGEIGNPVVLEDPDRELVYCATGGVTPDVAMRALDDLHRYERRGARNDGVFTVDLEGRGIAWGRVIALGIEAPLNDFQRAAVERGATAIALERVTRVQTERLRARSRGVLLADLLAGRATGHDASRRAELLGFPARPTLLLPLAARTGVRGRAIPPRRCGPMWPTSCGPASWPRGCRCCSVPTTPTCSRSSPSTAAARVGRAPTGSPSASTRCSSATASTRPTPPWPSGRVRMAGRRPGGACGGRSAAPPARSSRRRAVTSTPGRAASASCSTICASPASWRSSCASSSARCWTTPRPGARR